MTGGGGWLCNEIFRGVVSILAFNCLIWYKGGYLISLLRQRKRDWPWNFRFAYSVKWTTRNRLLKFSMCIISGFVEQQGNVATRIVAFYSNHNLIWCYIYLRLRDRTSMWGEVRLLRFKLRFLRVRLDRIAHKMITMCMNIYRHPYIETLETCKLLYINLFWMVAWNRQLLASVTLHAQYVIVVMR